jgi:Na+/proline symporter
MFLIVGVLLYLFFKIHFDLRVSLPVDLKGHIKQDGVFAHFIVNQMPHGLKGLVLAAILAAAMSTTSSAIGALTSVAVIDIIKVKSKLNIFNFGELAASRIVAIFVSLLLVLIAIFFERCSQSLLNEGLMVMTYAYGGMLAIFVIGRLFKNRGSEIGNVISIVCGIYTVLSFKFNSFLFPAMIIMKTDKMPTILNRPLAWPWFILIGFLVTFGMAVCFKTKCIPLKEKKSI